MRRRVDLTTRRGRRVRSCTCGASSSGFPHSWLLGQAYRIFRYTCSSKFVRASIWRKKIMDPVYNTLMAVPAGLALVMLAAMGWRLGRGGTVHRHAWATAFGTLGFVLTALGLHMTLTWPLSGPT